jgi:hypothetical protein
VSKSTNTHWHTTFIDALSATSSVVQAARAAGISPRTAYRHRKGNAHFREAWRRAVEGYDYPVTYGGQITDTYKKYSDTLLIFLLKANCPEKYARPGEVDDQDDELMTFRVVYGDE